MKFAAILLIAITFAFFFIGSSPYSYSYPTMYGSWGYSSYYSGYYQPYYHNYYYQPAYAYYNYPSYYGNRYYGSGGLSVFFFG